MSIKINVFLISKFFSLLNQKAPKEPILEEAELDFRPLEENEEYTEKDDSESEQTKDTHTETRCESDRNEGEKAIRHPIGYSISS